MTFAWVILAALLVTAFFSAAEMAFLGANRIRLRHLAEGGHRVAGRYLEAFSQPERLLSAAKMELQQEGLSGSDRMALRQFIAKLEHPGKDKDTDKFCDRAVSSKQLETHAQSLMLESVQAVIKKIEIENVLRGYPIIPQSFHCLVHVCRFPTSPHTYTHSRFSSNWRDFNAANNTCGQLYILIIQDNLF